MNEETNTTRFDVLIFSRWTVPFCSAGHAFRVVVALSQSLAFCGSHGRWSEEKTSHLFICAPNNHNGTQMDEPVFLPFLISIVRGEFALSSGRQPAISQRKFMKAFSLRSYANL